MITKFITPESVIDSVEALFEKNRVGFHRMPVEGGGVTNEGGYEFDDTMILWVFGADQRTSHDVLQQVSNLLTAQTKEQIMYAEAHVAPSVEYMLLPLRQEAAVNPAFQSNIADLNNTIRLSRNERLRR